MLLVSGTEIIIPVEFHPTRLLVLRAAQAGSIRRITERWALTYPGRTEETPPPGTPAGVILSTFAASAAWGSTRDGGTVFGRVLDVFLRWGLVDSHGGVTPLGRLVLDDWSLREAEGDYASCPYYAGTGDQKCDRGCWDEPRCIEEPPTGPWPLLRSHILGGGR